MMQNQLVLTGADFDKVKKELIACINSFWKFNTMDLCMLTFMQDPTVSNSVVPILMYDPTQALGYSYVFHMPTDDEEETSSSHFDPITVSPPLVIHPNKWGIRDRVFCNRTSPHTSPTPINPMGLKSKLQDGSIVSLEIDYTTSDFKFKTTLGFTIDEDPIFYKLGYSISIPFIEYAQKGFLWKSRSVLMVNEMVDKTKANHIYDATASEELFIKLKAQGEVQTPSGVKIFTDFIKQKPIETLIFNNSGDDTENMMSVCAETYYKEIVVYAFYAYATGW
jgi:hypothetical protein